MVNTAEDRKDTGNLTKTEKHLIAQPFQGENFIFYVLPLLLCGNYFYLLISNEKYYH